MADQLALISYHKC